MVLGYTKLDWAPTVLAFWKMIRVLSRQCGQFGWRSCQRYTDSKAIAIYITDIYKMCLLPFDTMHVSNYSAEVNSLFFSLSLCLSLSHTHTGNKSLLFLKKKPTETSIIYKIFRRWQFLYKLDIRKNVNCHR